MNVVSLFAGVGGLDLGFERAGMTTVGQVELDPFCREVLEKHWPGVPRHDDVRTAVDWWRSVPRPRVDVVAGGFPCTDLAWCGLGAGIEGTRSGLWADMAAFIGAVRPCYVVVENVPALLARGMGRVLGDLSALGLDADWEVVSACSVGAPHTRERVFIVAYPAALGREAGRGDGPGPSLLEPLRRGDEPGGPWAAESSPTGVAYGVPRRLDRVGAAGNAVVPQVAQLIGEAVMAAELEQVAA